MSPPRTLYTAGQDRTGKLGPIQLPTGINIEMPKKGIYSQPADQLGGGGGGGGGCGTGVFPLV